MCHEQLFDFDMHPCNNAPSSCFEHLHYLHEFNMTDLHVLENECWRLCDSDLRLRTQRLWFLERFLEASADTRSVRVRTRKHNTVFLEDCWVFFNSITASTFSDSCLLPPGDKVRRASGWASEGRAADGGGEAEEADAEEEPRVRLPDPPGEDGTAAPGAPGTSTSVPMKNTRRVRTLKLSCDRNVCI